MGRQVRTDFVPYFPVQDGESPFEYYERLYASGEEGSYRPLVDYFGLDEELAKAIAIASPAFNRDFVAGEMRQRIDRSGGGTNGAFIWLRNKYGLDDRLAKDVVDEFVELGRLGSSFDKVDLKSRVVPELHDRLAALRDKWGVRA